MTGEIARHPNSLYTLATIVGEATKHKIVGPHLPKGLPPSRATPKANPTRARVKTKKEKVKGKNRKEKASGPEASLVVRLV
jgi:hypothetical protein